MPIKVKYTIRCSGKIAPYESTYDPVYAHTQLTTLQRKAQNGEMFYCTNEVSAEEPLTRAEKYLMLVYEVRQLQRKYFDNGRKQSDLRAAFAKEAILDKWNDKTRATIDGSPGFEATLKALPEDSDRYRHFAFFQVVEEWRKLWKGYFAYKKLQDKNPDVEREMKKKCFDFEKAVDKYIRLTLKLL